MTTRTRDPVDEMSDMSTGKTLFVLAIVLGCFAVLWPKVFVPMLFQSPEKKVKTDQIQRGGPEFVHPALRGGDHGRPVFPGEEGKTLRRTLDKELRPGPVPGMRPSMGGLGPGVQPQAAQRGQGGTIGILMPLYTAGIVIFFVYTIMKIMFKKKEDSDDESRTNLSRQYARIDPNILVAPSEASMTNYQRMSHQSYDEQQCCDGKYSKSMNSVDKNFKDKSEELLASACETITSKNQQIGKIEEEPEKEKEELKLSQKEKAEVDARDEEILLLRKRLEETERAMKLIIEQINKSSTKENPTKLSEGIQETNRTEDASTDSQKCEEIFSNVEEHQNEDEVPSYSSENGDRCAPVENLNSIPEAL